MFAHQELHILHSSLVFTNYGNSNWSLWKWHNRKTEQATFLFACWFALQYRIWILFYAFLFKKNQQTSNEKSLHSQTLFQGIFVLIFIGPKRLFLYFYVHTNEHQLFYNIFMAFFGLSTVLWNVRLFVRVKHILNCQINKLCRTVTTNY